LYLSNKEIIKKYNWFEFQWKGTHTRLF